MKKNYYRTNWIFKKRITSIIVCVGTWSFKCEVLRTQQVVLKYHIILISPDAYTPLPSIAIKSPGTRWRSLSLTKTEISLHFYMQILKCRKTSLFTGSFYFVKVQIGRASDRSFTPKSRALQPPGSCDQLDSRLSVSPWWTLITTAHASHQPGCVRRALTCRAEEVSALFHLLLLWPHLESCFQMWVIPFRGLGEAEEGPAEGGPGQDLEGPKRLRRGTRS